MMKVISISFLLLLTSCAKSGGGGRPYDLSQRLPDGKWQGDSRKLTDGDESTVFVEVTIENNKMTTKEVGPILSTTIIDNFEYTTPNQLIWMDENYKKIGQCHCTTDECNCQAQTLGLKMRRQLAFKEHILFIKDKGTVVNSTFENEMLLYANQ